MAALQQLLEFLVIQNYFILVQQEEVSGRLKMVVKPMKIFLTDTLEEALVQLQLLKMILT